MWGVAYLKQLAQNQNEYEEVKKELQSEKEWDEKWGDRMNKLVFIGQDFDKEKLRKDLERSVVTDEELEQNTYEDPFPNWKERLEAEQAEAEQAEA